MAEIVLARLAKRRSAWNTADIRGNVERCLAENDVVLSAPDRTSLAEALTAQVRDACVPLVDGDEVPEHIRSLTSPHVMDVEADLTTRLTSRAKLPDLLLTRRRLIEPHRYPDLDPTQLRVVDAMTRLNELVIVEGAAGTGKTSTLAAAREELVSRGRRMVVVTPTLKAAEVAERQVGTDAFSAHWLVRQYGFRWDEDGRWSRDPNATVPRRGSDASLEDCDVLVVDEAAMVDQDLARALVTVADERRAMLVLIGDPFQLPAVGRGGFFQLGAQVSTPARSLTLNRVHRFADPDYADLSLDMRAGRRSGEVFDQLMARGLIRIHATDVERSACLARSAADQIIEQVGTGHLMVETREQVATLNAAIRDHLVAAGYVDDTTAVTTAAGQRIGAGDQIATRRNNRDLEVANRDTWTVDHVTDPGTDYGAGAGGLVVSDGRRRRSLPADYVEQHVQLAYASTVYAAQGETVDHADVALDETSTAAAAYVAMTRGRHSDTAHLVATDIETARDQWIGIFSRLQADLGPAAAAEAAQAAMDAYGVRMTLPTWEPATEPTTSLTYLSHSRDRSVPR